MLNLRISAFAFVFSAAGLGAQEKRTIEIPFAVSAAKATEILQLVALRQDVSILSNEGGVVQFEPIHPKKGNPTTVTLRANVVRLSDSTSIVAISGRWFSPLTMMQQRIIVGRDMAPMQKDVGEPVEPATKGWKAILWGTVKSFGDSVAVAAAVR